MKFQSTGQHEYEFQMVSFVDVIFVLLSFFVLGSSFVLPERVFGLGHADANLSTKAKPEDFPDNIQVELRRHGDAVAIRVGSAKLSDNGFDELRAKLVEINMPNLAVMIAADPELSVDLVAKALDAALAGPMKKVSLSRLVEAAPPVAAAGAEAAPTGGGR
jgi:biopolymer transport protein ExbD